MLATGCSMRMWGKMIRVGILTFHYINNYGALLQAYALKKTIDKLEGYHAEIINYIPEGFEYYPYEVGTEGKKRMEQKVALLHHFLNVYCEIKTAVISAVTGSEYDIYCVGSDQVWNFDISNHDTTYLLSGVDDTVKKISYASSIGLPINRVQEHKDIFIKYLSRFDHVSVREEEHAKWLQKECNIDCETVLDPTFLINPEEYEEIISKEKLRNHPFMLFIWYQHQHDDQLTKAVEFSNTVSRKYGLPIVHNILNVRPYILANDDGYMFYEGVEDFLWYIKNASVIVTNSYHVMLFSIHFKRPFYIYLVESMRSRFDTLGDMFSINDRFVTKYIEPDTITINMDYENIYKKIEPYREKSKKYLVDALELK